MLPACRPVSAFFSQSKAISQVSCWVGGSTLDSSCMHILSYGHVTSCEIGLCGGLQLSHRQQLVADVGHEKEGIETHQGGHDLLDMPSTAFDIKQ